MEYGGVLLLFDGDNPSWTEELVGMAGEDPGLLGAMVADGLLRDEGGVFSLTDAGREAFREEAAACFLPASPGTPGAAGGSVQDAPSPAHRQEARPALGAEGVRA